MSDGYHGQNCNGASHLFSHFLTLLPPEKSTHLLKQTAKNLKQCGSLAAPLETVPDARTVPH
jgi:hypothetical protein